MTLDEIDIYNPDNYVLSPPYAQLDYLREHAPVYWHPHPAGGGFWVVTRHADVLAVAKDHQRFSAQERFVLVDDLPADVLEMATNQLLGMDPPAHGPLRRLVITRFSKKLLAELEPSIRLMSCDILDAIADPERCEFVSEVAGHLPTRVICDVLQVPRDMWDQVREWSDLQTSADDPEICPSPDVIQQAAVEMGTYGFQLACERKGGDGDNLISTLINVELDGQTLSEMEFASLFIQIAVAGNETTRTLISSGMRELALHPELFTELKNHPQRIPDAVEEMLRWVTPLHYFCRTAKEDVELGGQLIRRGDKVLMSYTAANRDPAVFANPYMFDIHRPGDANAQLAFGYGIHLCLGANLARMEARVFFEEFLRRYSAVELLGEGDRLRSNLINGYKRIPMRLIA